MTLHTSLGRLSIENQEYIRLSARWAVPFFFITTGFFLGKKISKCNVFNFDAIQLNFVKLISIFLVANIIYLPIYLYIDSKYFNIENLLIGSYSHLWFIGSLIFGYIVISYFYFIDKVKVLKFISVLLLFFALLANSYDLFFKIDLNYDLFRFLISIPFMYVGIWISEKSFNKNIIPVLIVLTIAGILLQYVESEQFYRFYGYNRFDQQLLLGTVLSAISLFILCTIIKIKDNIFSEWGRKYSLFVYIYHPFVYVLMGFLIVKFIPNELNTILIFFPIIGFFIILTTGIFLDKYFKAIYKLLTGDLIKEELAK